MGARDKEGGKFSTQLDTLRFLNTIEKKRKKHPKRLANRFACLSTASSDTRGMGYTRACRLEAMKTFDPAIFAVDVGLVH